MQPRGLLGPLREISLDLAATRLVQDVVHESLQIVFEQVRHFTTLNSTAGCTPAIRRRMRSLARDSRDITVPIGIASARLTSS